MDFNKSISVIGGAGHVGLPLGLAFASKNFRVKLVIKATTKNITIFIIIISEKSILLF